jgi:AraC-like DNA-binding protein
MNPPDWMPAAHLALHSAGTMRYPAGATFGPRRLPDYEMVWIVSGRATASLDGKKIPAPAGTVLLARPGMIDAYDWATDEETLHGFIHFDIGRLGRGWPDPSEWPLVRTPSPDGIFFVLFRYALGSKAAPRATAAAVLPGVVDLLLRIFLAGADEAPPSLLHDDLPELIQAALRLMRARQGTYATDNVTLTDLARSLHVSAQHLCRVFKRRLGVGPMECLRLLRVERAASLLERTDEPVSAVGEAVGFSTPYHFSRTFKKVYGLSPRAFRTSFRERLQAGIPETRKPALYGSSALNWLIRG